MIWNDLGRPGHQGQPVDVFQQANARIPIYLIGERLASVTDSLTEPFEPKKDNDFVLRVGRALRRAGRVARKTARMHGTPIYIWRDGKIVAEKP